MKYLSLLFKIFSCVNNPNIKFKQKFLFDTQEFSKLRAFCAYVPYVPTGLHALFAYVPLNFTCLRAYVPTCFTCLSGASTLYVPTCFRAFIP